MAGKEKLYVKVYNDIISKIKNEELKVGDRLPTEFEMTKIYGVSRITVAHALKMLTEINLIYRVKKMGTFVNGKVNYKNTQLIIPIILPFDEDFNGITEGAQNLALLNNTFTPIYNTRNNIKRERDILSNILEMNADGVITYPCTTLNNIDLYARLRARKIPVVCIDRNLDGIDTPLVTSNNEQGMRDVVGELAFQGHRRIAFFSISDNMASAEIERFKGYCTGMINNGLDILPQYLYRAEDLHKREHDLTMPRQNQLFHRHVSHFVSECLLGPEPPTAVCCINDVSANELYEQAVRAGIRVPGDLMITGFDAASFTRHLFPGFVTVKQDFRLIGKTALGLMLDLLNGQKTEKVIRVGVRLITTE